MGQKEEALQAYLRAEKILLANEVYDDLLLKKGKLELELGKNETAANTFLILQNAAGEGMWKQEAYFYYAQALFNLQSMHAKEVVESYLLKYPNGFYTEKARTMYRTFAP